MKNVDTCKQLNGTEYGAAYAEIEKAFVFTPDKPIPIALRLGFPFELPEKATLIVSLGTSAHPDGVEYVGPVASQIQITADEGLFGLPKYPPPFIELINHDTQERCFWTTEQGLALTEDRTSFAFQLNLLASKRSDIMGNIDLIDRSE